MRCVALTIAAAACAKPVPYCAPLLEFQNGSTVSTPEQWFDGRRQEVSRLLQESILGTVPADPPPLLASEVLNTTTFEDGTTSSFVHLKYDVSAGGTMSEVSFEIEILSPNDAQPAPLFLTQWNHREWALVGLSRGYVGVVYPGADLLDHAPDFQRAYPNNSMMLIVARAFLVSRVLDYVLAEVAGLAPGQVAITGHSRNGKQSLIAAALDERITAVVGSSPGAPISAPFAFSSHNFYGEGPDSGMAGNWWLKSITDYTARPQTLPMDGHGVLALVAPRHCAIAGGWTDHEGDTAFADEMGVRAASEVYDLLGSPEKLRLIHRPGDHHGFNDYNTYFDWFDHAFGRVPAPEFPLAWMGEQQDPRQAWPQVFLTPAGFDWEVWAKAFKNQTKPAPVRSAPLTSRIKWLLQLNEPTAFSPGSDYSEDGAREGPGDYTFSYMSVMMGYDFETYDSGVHRLPVSFGDSVTGNVYWPAGASSAKGPLPAVVWLHPHSYSTGYASAYEWGGPNVVRKLVHAGFVVLAYDQVGHATRIREGGTSFYRRHGNRASLLGHMVRDAQAAVGFLACLSDATSPKCGPLRMAPKLEKLPAVDASMILAAGYSLGGNVALHAAALDSRIAAVAAFAAFTPMRTDFENRSTHGLRRLYDLHALLPRLGLFAEDPASVPYDYDEVLSAIAPRPTLLYTPKQDRDATFGDVQACVDAARSSWGEHTAALKHTAPDTYTTMDGAETSAIVDWARSLLPASIV